MRRCNLLDRPWLELHPHLLFMVVSSSGSGSKSSAHTEKMTANLLVPAAQEFAQISGAREVTAVRIPSRVNAPMKLAGASLPRRSQSAASARPAFVTSSPRSLVRSHRVNLKPTTNRGTPPRSRAQCISTNLSSHFTFPSYPPRNTTFLHSFFHAP